MKKIIETCITSSRAKHMEHKKKNPKKKDKIILCLAAKWSFLFPTQFSLSIENSDLRISMFVWKLCFAYSNAMIIIRFSIFYPFVSLMHSNNAFNYYTGIRKAPFRALSSVSGNNDDNDK